MYLSDACLRCMVQWSMQGFFLGGGAIFVWEKKNNHVKISISAVAQFLCLINIKKLSVWQQGAENV